ncbi:sensor histidine kinase [Robbsia andropogonis]|uniref:sensor histidine kinase n=1 Tax=Robbsia andropogonis TaxID=28092 RepID=UPI000A41B9C0|nr:ATP-binding protein [Robbsia andropogonis]MCP1118782.1 histidine kinase [Robbsia andropogonis]MCP1128249.1 histidine kinase [Robbsia andropogonis]
MAGSLRAKLPASDVAEQAASGAPVAPGMMGVVLRDEERVRLARDIHDDLGAELTALRISLSRVAVSDGFVPNSQAARALTDAETALDAAFAAMRRLIDDRHTLPPATDLVARLQDWVESFSQRSGLHITFDCKTDPRLAPMDEASATAVWRICQEALHNVVKHAQATSATVALSVLATGVRLMVSDNGRGIAAARRARAERAAQEAFDDVDVKKTASASPSDKTEIVRHHTDGVGLESMRQRCEALGGRFSLIDQVVADAPQPEALHAGKPDVTGTIVEAALPWIGPQPKERRSPR